MTDWRKIKAIDYCKKVTDGTHDSPKRTDIGKPLITSKHIKKRSIDFDTAYLISEDDYQKINQRSKVDQWDVLISMIGEYCGFAYIERNKVIDYAIKNVGVFKAGNKIDAEWLYYFLMSPLGRESLSQSRSGTSQPYISLGSLRSLEILIPINESIKKSVTKILSSLDDKIELNNQINRELEALAQALFKRWFVDFEFPDENGVPYKSSGGAMVDSELGEIPLGWEVKKISSICEVKDGTHDSPKQVIDGEYLITSKHLKSSYIDFDSAYKISKSDYFDVNKRSKVDKYDILITMIGTVGNLYFVSEEPNYAIKNIGLFKTSQRGDFGYFFYEYLNSDLVTRFYQERLAGSTQQYLTLRTLRETPVLYEDRIIRKYIIAIKELREQIFLFAAENQSLIELRDTLLPKLISGELEVSAEAPLENVV